MQSVAAELQHAETAFVRPSPGGDAEWELRWFTPTIEVDLCGHATLATTHALLADGLVSGKVGLLDPERGADGFGRRRLDHPRLPGQPDGRGGGAGGSDRGARGRAGQCAQHGRADRRVRRPARRVGAPRTGAGPGSGEGDQSARAEPGHDRDRPRGLRLRLRVAVLRSGRRDPGGPGTVAARTPRWRRTGPSASDGTNWSDSRRPPEAVSSASPPSAIASTSSGQAITVLDGELTGLGPGLGVGGHAVRGDRVR